QSRYRRFYWFPRDNTRTSRFSSKDLPALRYVEPRAIRPAEGDARHRRGRELGLVQDVRAASGLLADLNAHGAGGPHVSKRVDRQAADAAEQSLFRHLQPLERLTV